MFGQPQAMIPAKQIHVWVHSLGMHEITTKLHRRLSWGSTSCVVKKRADVHLVLLSGYTRTFGSSRLTYSPEAPGRLYRTLEELFSVAGTPWLNRIVGSVGESQNMKFGHFKH